MLLPVAFRSLPRPSSPDSSKASPANSSSLDHITPTSSSQRSIKLGISTPQTALARAPPASSTFFSVPFSVEPTTFLRTVSSVRCCQRPCKAHGAKRRGRYLMVLEVWGFEPQTYGLQSHRSSHLSYTPVRNSPGEERRESRRRDRVFRVTLGAAAASSKRSRRDK